MAWTDQQIATLRDMAEAGASRRAMADTLGKNINSVIGKCHRLGLSVAKIRPARAERPKREAGVPYRKGGLKGDVRAPSFVDLPAEQSSVAVTLLNLKRGACRWPISGDGRDVGAMLFCGAAQAEEGCSYCEAHKQRSVVRREAA